MASSKNEQKNERHAISRVARYPVYTDAFAESFYDGFVESKWSYIKQRQTEEDRLRFFGLYGSILFMGTLFRYARAGIHLYRELNIKRLVKLHSSTYQGFVPEFPDIVSERLEAFLQRYSKVDDVDDRVLRKGFVPAFLRSTEFVVGTIAAELNQFDTLNPYLSIVEMSRIEPTLQQALRSADDLVRVFASASDRDIEIMDSIDHYKKAIRALNKPAGLYQPLGLEKLYVAGLELEMLNRLAALFLSDAVQSSRAAEILETMKIWSETHRKLLSKSLKPIHSYDVRVRHSTGMISTSNSALLHREIALPGTIFNLFYLLRKFLPPRGTFFGSKRFVIETHHLNRASSMRTHYHRWLIRTFEIGIWTVVTGLAIGLAGVWLNDFPATYFGTGATALGLTTITLSLIWGIETVSQHE